MHDIDEYDLTQSGIAIHRSLNMDFFSNINTDFSVDIIRNFCQYVKKINDQGLLVSRIKQLRWHQMMPLFNDHIYNWKSTWAAKIYKKSSSDAEAPTHSESVSLVRRTLKFFENYICAQICIALLADIAYCQHISYIEKNNFFHWIHRRSQRRKE